MIQNGNAGYGIGINRRTWRNGRLVGKYLKRGYDLVKPYLKRTKAKRSVKLEQTRSLRRAFNGVQVPAGGGGESKSSFSLVKKNYSNIGKLELTDGAVARSSGFSSATTQGLQTSINVGSYLNNTDIANIVTVAAGLSAAGQASTKLFVKSAHATIMITNAEFTNVHFTIYDLEQKIDASTTLNPDPSTVFLAGGVDATGGAAANFTLPGSAPYSNPRFMAGYKILKQTPVILSTGQTHTHNVHYAPNKILDFEHSIMNAISGGGLAGRIPTVWTMIVQHGTPVHDDTTETSVTIGASKLDIVIMETIKYKYCAVGYALNSITTTLATNLTGFQAAESTPVDIADAS